MNRNKMSKDRVHFYMASRYFCGTRNSNGMQRESAIKVLNKAFGQPDGHGSSWACVMKTHERGFHIICRPSQFARFIIYRHEMGECINGVRDLEPALHAEQPQRRVHDLVVDKYAGHLDECDVRSVLNTACVENNLVDTMVDGWFDVSRNPHDDGTVGGLRP